MPKSKHPDKRQKPPFLGVITLCACVALIEAWFQAAASEAFRQYLRDLSLPRVYGNIVGAVLLYALVGQAGWTLLWGGFRIAKKEPFFNRQALSIFFAAILTLYGFWALRTFLFQRELLSRWGLAGGTVGVAILAFGVGRLFQKYLSPEVGQRGIVVFAVATLALPLFLRPSWREEIPAQKQPNLILLTVDTLRPDDLGFYGSRTADTPHLDALAGKGTRFQQAYAQIPLTGPSFASILTGLHPRSHGARQNLMPLDPSLPTLAEILQDAGYRTAAFVSGYPLKREFCGLHRGFDLYQDRFSFFDGYKLFRFLERLGWVDLQYERRAEEVSRLVIPWLGRHPKNPFFLWVHYYDPHVPYRPPNPAGPDGPFLSKLRNQRPLWGKGKEALSVRLIEGMKRLYGGEIAYVDRDIGQLLSFLDASGLREQSLIVFLSDHGESFDHDYYFDHGDRLYESCIRIPVLFVYPGVIGENAVSEEVIRSIDLFPTLLTLLKLPKEPSEGESLFKEDGTLITGRTRPVFAELSRRPGYPTLGDLWALREGSWKLIYSPEGRPPELYHLGKDSEELKNLSGQNRKQTRTMQSSLIRWMGKGSQEGRSRPVEGLMREKLRSIGYLQ